MKKFFVAAILLSIAVMGFAQKPVAWSFTAKKISDKKYELHMKAAVAKTWHLYAQQQPKDAIAKPTSFEFGANPLLALTGKPKEKGKLEIMRDAALGISAWQYADSVDFVQSVTLKTKAKTNINGLVAYQVCNDKKCLPLDKVQFSLALN